MSAKRLAFAVSASFLLASSLAARAHEDEAPGGKLGSVSFATCSVFSRSVRAIRQPTRPDNPITANRNHSSTGCSDGSSFGSDA